MEGPSKSPAAAAPAAAGAVPGARGAGTARSYRRIDPALLHDTLVALVERIGAHFPDSGLRKVGNELIDVSLDTPQRIRFIRRRSTILRVLAWLLSVIILLILLTVPFALRPGKVETLADAVQVLEAALSASFFIGASILFLLTWESRMRHGRTMDAIHELRAMAHVVDMHQLTKDPPMLLDAAGLVAAASASAPEVEVAPTSPPRRYTPFDLQRYLDYCTEMLSLISKIAVLYAQDSSDAQTIGVIDEIEELANGLSRKIWQKIILIQRTASVTGHPLPLPPSLVPAAVPTQTVAT